MLSGETHNIFLKEEAQVITAGALWRIGLVYFQNILEIPASPLQTTHVNPPALVAL